MPDRQHANEHAPHNDKDDGRPAAGEPSERSRADRGDGPGKVGVTSDEQPDPVSPSGVNERDHGAANDKPMGGGSVNLDDDDMIHPRGNTTGTGGTWDSTGGDSAPPGPPREIQSDRIGPSDPDHRKK